jgi:GTP-binding protein
MDVELIISAARPGQFPKQDLPEVAFLGRSNVGKSSLLNTLLGAGRAARTSSRPGCTRQINFFRVENRLVFADLPGYGYARVPVRESAGWKELVEAYLEKREALALSLLLLDARRGWMEKDLELKRWLEFHNRRYLVIATKFDKLRTQTERHHGLAGIRAHSECEPVPFSAVTGQGVREIWQAISRISNP